MPLFAQPTLRELQQMLESSGVIQTRDSLEVTQLKARETAGTLTKVIPKIFWAYRGTSYTAQ